MMTNVLLTSSKFIKGITNISDNVQDKMLLPAIREAQEIDLKGVIGESLIERLKSMVMEKAVDEPDNSMYKALLDKCQYFLAYQSVSRLTVILSYKIDNVGVSRTRDENIEYAPYAEVMQMESYYQEKADAFKYQLQNWIIENRTSFPELDQNGCDRISANLYSAASSGLFLGGARGKAVNNPKGTYIGK